MDITFSSSSSSHSATSSISHSSTMEEDVQLPAESDTRGSCYFPGCRKNANCDCQMCLESINATLDLMPSSNRRVSFAKPKPFSVDKTCISIDPTLLSTPKLETPRIRVSTTPCTVIRSTAKSRCPLVNEKEPQAGKVESLKRDCGSGHRGLGLVRWVMLLLSLILGLELGISWLVSSGMLRPRLSADVVRVLGERCSGEQDMSEKLKLLEKELMERFSVKDGTISSCSFDNSLWEINQDGSILSSRCSLYQSASEEVSVWGWPLQSAGILAAGLSNRSFTVISGRITELPNGRAGYLVRNASSSWTIRKWNVSPVHLHPDTWIVEYRKSVWLENSPVLSAAGELLKHRVFVVLRRVRQRLWVFPFLDGGDCSCNSRSKSRSHGSSFVPT